MEVEYCRVPPGFRFHPTEEELVGYYLTRKVASQKIDLGVITDIDLYKIEPWDLQERCKLGYDEQNEWYFFSHKDKKYPSGTRTNRATTAGFWKATGRDKAVLSKCKVIGMRKTLVFYEGRAPNGKKSDWIMHEYRLQSSEHGPPQEEGWVVCRAFKKPVPNPRPCYSTYSPFYIREQDQFAMEHLPDITRPTNPGGNFYEQPFGFGREHEPKLTCSILDIPRLDSPSMSTTLATTNYECFESGAMIIRNDEISNLQRNDESRGQFVDWKVLDKLLASQLTESGSSSNLNFPLMNTLDQYDVNDPNQENCFLGSYP